MKPMFYTDDPVADFNRYDREQAKRLAELPVCDHCSKPIQDEDLFDIEGVLYHLECAEQEFKKKTDDYMER